MVDDVVFGPAEEIDLRAPENREFKRIADRLSRYARDSWAKGVVATFVVDPDAKNQQALICVAADVEEIVEESSDDEE